MKTERFKPIPGYEGRYEAGDLGNIRSLPKIGRKAVMLKKVTLPNGYQQVRLYDSAGDFKCWPPHRLVALTFLPAVEGKNCVNHKDLDKTNNRVENLEWCDHTENIHHRNRLRPPKWAHQRGEENGHAKLTEELVREAKAQCAAGVSQAEIARRYGVAPSQISRAVRGERWNHF